LRCSRQLLRAAKIFRKVGESAHHRVRRKAAQRTQRTEFHRVAKVLDEQQVGLAILSVDDLVHRFATAYGPDPAWRALAAAFDGTELKGKACLTGHVSRIVEDDDASVADEAVAGGERLIVKRGVEQVAGEVSPQGTADLNGFD